MLRFRLHPEAEREALETARWIKADDPRQAALFIQALEKAITSARTQPDLYRCFDGEFRKVRVGKVRNAVVFCKRAAEIQIIAVMHLHREPGYWKERAEDWS